eukprot:TRINITY_DN6773_c1_g1_i1.p1 TRINITY_DN6773_c1_g1~~TRINITY_DN6773_c1_g1_i1.p1  ORF type:complete len:781 (+),score=215.90 TRINITY_DN6773_c1_g1_i1:73-2343(+)
MADSPTGTPRSSTPRAGTPSPAAEPAAAASPASPPGAAAAAAPPPPAAADAAPAAPTAMLDRMRFLQAVQEVARHDVAQCIERYGLPAVASGSWLRPGAPPLPPQQPQLYSSPRRQPAPAPVKAWRPVGGPAARSRVAGGPAGGPRRAAAAAGPRPLQQPAAADRSAGAADPRLTVMMRQQRKSADCMRTDFAALRKEVAALAVALENARGEGAAQQGASSPPPGSPRSHRAETGASPRRADAGDPVAPLQQPGSIAAAAAAASAAEAKERRRRRKEQKRQAAAEVERAKLAVRQAVGAASPAQLELMAQLATQGALSASPPRRPTAAACTSPMKVATPPKPSRSAATSPLRGASCSAATSPLYPTAVLQTSGTSPLTLLQQVDAAVGGSFRGSFRGAADASTSPLRFSFTQGAAAPAAAPPLAHAAHRDGPPAGVPGLAHPQSGAAAAAVAVQLAAEAAAPAGLTSPGGALVRDPTVPVTGQYAGGAPDGEVGSETETSESSLAPLAPGGFRDVLTFNSTVDALLDRLKQWDREAEEAYRGNEAVLQAGALRQLRRYDSPSPPRCRTPPEAAPGERGSAAAAPALPPAEAAGLRARLPPAVATAQRRACSGFFLAPPTETFEEARPAAADESASEGEPPATPPAAAAAAAVPAAPPDPVVADDAEQQEQRRRRELHPAAVARIREGRDLYELCACEAASLRGRIPPGVLTQYAEAVCADLLSECFGEYDSIIGEVVTSVVRGDLMPGPHRVPVPP